MGSLTFYVSKIDGEAMIPSGCISNPRFHGVSYFFFPVNKPKPKPAAKATTVIIVIVSKTPVKSIPSSIIVSV